MPSTIDEYFASLTRHSIELNSIFNSALKIGMSLTTSGVGQAGKNLILIKIELRKIKIITIIKIVLRWYARDAVASFIIKRLVYIDTIQNLIQTQVYLG